METAQTDLGYWYRHKYNLPVTDPRYLDSCLIDWRIDYELEKALRERESGETSAESDLSEEEISDLMSDDSFWESVSG